MHWISRTRGWLLAWLIGPLLVACATMDTVKNAPATAGAVSSFNAPYDKVTAATFESLRGLRVEISSSNEQPEGLVILVSKSMTAFSYGEIGRITVERSQGATTNVRVVWEKRDQVQITGTSQQEFSKDLFAGIQTALTRL
ncbi:MAG TPA: hypothetical protein VMB81_16180 [Candidatus Sulfotelmatobacter sp.]|nr:hypothetical protein [Candidatus Sulfotelmatobacter sp.]